MENYFRLEKESHSRFQHVYFQIFTLETDRKQPKTAHTKRTPKIVKIFRVRFKQYPVLTITG